MVPRTSSVAGLSREARIAIVCATVAVVVLATALLPPFAQPEHYHQFADQRTLLGVPNFLDVASNLAFLVVGVWGLVFVIRGKLSDGSAAFRDESERWGWGVGFLAVTLTCCGSSFYHWAPDSARLFWDRLPMAVGFMGILTAIVSERISAPAGRRLLIPLIMLGAASVLYWRWSAEHGVENLNPYGAVQFGTAFVILVICVLFPPRYTRSWDLVGGAALYALAKVAEDHDRAIFAATGEIVSGHTLKHLLAAAAVCWLLRMLMLRRPVKEVVAG